MLRRMWASLSGPSLRREGGGQHAEAGALIATLVLLGGAMVAAAPSVGEATSNFWVCEIQGSGAAQCGGDGTGTPRRGALEVDVDLDADPEGTADSAAFHEPGVTTPDEKLTAGTWGTPGGDVKMSRCDLWAPNSYLCTAPDGTVWDCYYGYCSDTTIPTYPMTCSNEGTSPETRLCRTKNGGIYHCTNTTDKDRLSCRGTDNDSDAEMPDGAVPVACGDDNSAEGSVTCIGSNGTLYQCPRGAAYGSDCEGGGRNINREDVSLSDCVKVPQYGEDAVQCTYTATDRECPADATEGCQLPQRQTTVLCHDDPPGTPNGAYQHCQDLGVLADPDDKVEGVCVSESSVDVDGSDVCANEVTTVVSDDPPEGVGPETEVGPVSVSLPEDQLTTVTLPDGTSRQMTQDELTSWCETDEAACTAELDRQHSSTVSSLEDSLRQAGACSTTAQCDALINGGAEHGRKLLASDKKLRIAMAATLSVLGLVGTVAIVSAATIEDIPTRLGAVTGVSVAVAAATYAAITLFESARAGAGAAEGRAAAIAAQQWVRNYVAEQLAGPGVDVANLQLEMMEQGQVVQALQQAANEHQD